MLKCLRFSMLTHQVSPAQFSNSVSIFCYYCSMYILAILTEFLELLSEPKTHLGHDLGHLKSEQSIFGSTLGDEPK